MITQSPGVGLICKACLLEETDRLQSKAFRPLLVPSLQCSAGPSCAEERLPDGGSGCIGGAVQALCEHPSHFPLAESLPLWLQQVVSHKPRAERLQRVRLQRVRLTFSPQPSHSLVTPRQCSAACRE